MEYTINFTGDGIGEYHGGVVKFTSSKTADETFFELALSFSEWEENTYVFAPACIYDGNRARRVKRIYPPMYYEGETDTPTILRGIPAMGEDGKGTAEFTVGDMASPIIGIYYPKKGEALFIYTEQKIKDKNIGFRIESGRIAVCYPSRRSVGYRFEKEPVANPDSGIRMTAGEQIASRILIESIECSGIKDFYGYFFENRKKLCSSERPKNGYTEDLLRIMIDHFNEHNFSGRYYGNTLHVTWQTGWTGGGMSSYPLYMLGGETEKRRAEMTLDFMTDLVAESGLLHGVVYNFTDIRDDSKYKCLRSEGVNDEGYKHMEGAHLIRRSGDALIFLIKQLRVMEAKEKWIDAARRVADALVKIYNENGTFGQYVNIDTGKMMVAMGSGGASAVGGLVLAADYFSKSEYLEVAKAAGEYYYRNFTEKGITNGAPGDNMLAADSESAYALVESFMLLYEATGDGVWLDRCADATKQFSSWVMTYAYEFPAGCEFGRLGINTVGSVFANVQNKHSAPGICTFSGDAILKLYRYTGEALYLDLIKDIAYFMPQCVSTEERPIYDWDHESGDEAGKLPQGYICERVNTSDWEGVGNIGGVFNVSCWCETSVLLSFLELMGDEEMQ